MLKIVPNNVSLNNLALGSLNTGHKLTKSNFPGFAYTFPIHFYTWPIHFLYIPIQFCIEFDVLGAWVDLF